MGLNSNPIISGMPKGSIEILLDSNDHLEDAYAKWKLVGRYRVYESAKIVSSKLYEIDTDAYPLNMWILEFICSRDRETPGNPLCFWKIDILGASQQVVEAIQTLVINILWLNRNEIIIK